MVFYDQLGCGNSDRPDDESLWTVERFVEELEAVLDHLMCTCSDTRGELFWLSSST